MTPLNVHILTSGTCEYVALQGTRDSEDVNKVKYLGMWETIQGCPSGPHIIIQVLKHREIFLVIIRMEVVTAEVR